MGPGSLLRYGAVIRVTPHHDAHVRPGSVPAEIYDLPMMRGRRGDHDMNLLIVRCEVRTGQNEHHQKRTQRLHWRLLCLKRGLPPGPKARTGSAASDPPEWIGERPFAIDRYSPRTPVRCGRGNFPGPPS